MRHAWSRGFVLRALSVGTVVAMTASVPIPALAAEPAVTVPASAWTPGQVNRTVVGGAPPEAPQEMKARRWSCRSSDWGVLPDYPMERFRISDRLQFGVNLSSGSLWIDHRALTIPGAGQAMTVRHSRGYDDKWHFNAGESMRLDTSFTGQVHMPMDGGACAEFIETNGTYGMGSNGIRAKLTKNAGGSYTVRFIDTGETWSYNAGGWLLNRADRNGNTITYYYNSNGSIASVADTQGRVTTFTTDTSGRVTKVTDPSGTTVGEYTYDDRDNLTRFTDRAGNSVSITYNEHTSPLTLTDQLGRTWSFAYDDWGNVSKVTTPRPGGAVDTLFTYDSDTQTTMTDPNSNKTVYTFDDENRQISAKDANGNTQSRTWTANSDIQSVTNGLNNSTTATYDTLDNLISTKLPTGASTTVGYTNTSLPNLPTSVKDPAGNEITRDYDSAGNLTKIRSVPLAADLEVRSYSGPKKLLDYVKDANGNVTYFDYDSAGNLVTTTPPAPLGPTRYTYDSLSRITSITDGAGKRIDYSYDRLDRILSISHNGAVLQAMHYDATGALTTRETPQVKTTFTYDTHPTGRQPAVVTRTQSGATETVSYAYDKTGNLKTLTDPAGTATYGYDPGNRLTSLRDAFGQTTTFAYDRADRRTSTTWPGAGSQATGYDNSGRQTSLVVKNAGGTELLKATYSFTTASGADSDRMQSKTVAGTTTTYTYDQLHHLSKAGSVGYTVDKLDNITNFGGTAHTVNAANQLTAAGATTLGYDAAGNMTTEANPAGTYAYSPTNQLISGTRDGAPSFSASYDTVNQAQPRTITETIAGTATTHIFTHTALGISSTVDNGVRSSVSRDPDGKLVTQKAGTSRYNFVTDYQGSVLALVDTTGAIAATYTYNPYGSVTATGPAAAANAYRYNGGYTLQGGLVLFGYRYYNSGRGRFTSPDPTNQERNAYAYAESDPINNSDPTGASTGSSVGAFIGGTLGMAVGVGLTLACPATAGLGCAGAAAVMGGLGGGAGAALGSKIGGGTSQDVSTDGLLGVAGGALKGVARLPGEIAKLF
ncbi:RHS repeat-associated protein [Lentzea atacamensis]|uniref:RHS repeat-associated protein n=2 Tax=Lentzea atacamensis TaxID=531938 RepID=A0ABX9EE88_9PSEU|nr:RHS repeat-associated protein [Lentzea atacamensis]